MFQVALKGLLGHKLRMLLTAFSIIIGVSFVAGSYIFTDSIGTTFDGIIDDVYTSVDVVVRPDAEDLNSVGEGIDESVVEQLSSINEIKSIQGEVAGLAFVALDDGTLTGASNGPPSLGFGWGENSSLSPLSVREGNGRPPESMGEVAIDLNTAKNKNISIGNVLSIQGGDSPLREFEVVGLLSFGETDSLAGATLVVFEFSEAQELFGLEGRLSQISISAEEGVSPEELRDLVAAKVPSGVETIVGEQQRSEELDEIGSGLNIITTALLSFAGVSVFVGSFIIQNTFRIVISQRSKELALLRAIGALRSQIIRLVAYEAFIVSIVASIAGIFAGMGLSILVRAVINMAGVGLPDGPLTIEPRTVYVSMVVGVIVTMVSAILPAIKASRVAPVEAMRDFEASTPRRSLRVRAAVGLLIVTVGAGALMYGLFSSAANPVYYVGTGAAIMFLGVSVIAPLLSGVIANLIGYVTDAVYGLVGKIAKQNAKRSPRRTASTASALMIGVALVSFATIFASSAKATIDEVFVKSFPGDVLISSKLLGSGPGDLFENVLPSDIGEKVNELSEVDLVTGVKYDGTTIKVNGNTEPELVIGIDPATFNSAFKLDPTGGDYDSLTKNTIFIRQAKLGEFSLTIGDDISLEFAKTGVVDFKISGSFTEAFDSPFLLSNETFVENSPISDDLILVANISSGTSIPDGREAITNSLEGYPIVQVQDKNELISTTRTQIDQALQLLSALLGFAIIIAILGITNTLTLSVSERTREIGMLRAVGMTRRQVRKMIRIESIIIAVFGAILGVVMGIFFAWAILKSLEDLGFTAFSVPLVQIAIYLAAAALAGVFAAILPSFRASRMNILDAINYE